MIRFMRTTLLERPELELTSLHQEVMKWHVVSEILAAITDSGGSTDKLNDVLGIKASHVGFTYYRDVQAGDRLTIDGRVYKVDYVRPGRLQQLMLEEVRPIGGG